MDDQQIDREKLGETLPYLGQKLEWDPDAKELEAQAPNRSELRTAYTAFAGLCENGAGLSKSNGFNLKLVIDIFWVYIRRPRLAFLNKPMCSSFGNDTFAKIWRMSEVQAIEGHAVGNNCERL